MPRDCNSGAEANQLKAQTLKSMRNKQVVLTKLMLRKLGNLDHIPARMRPVYECYRNALSNGHAHAYRFHYDGKSHD